MEPTLTFRFAEEKDIPFILDMIHEQASEGNAEEQMIATAEQLKEWLFETKRVEVLMEEQGDTFVGMVLFFETIAAFMGYTELYMQDFYLRPAYHGQRYGPLMLQKLASIALERGCQRLEWACQAWNHPSVEFHLRMSAASINSKDVYRIAGASLQEFAAQLPEEYR